ncbi:MAG: orotidine-5'-phosphate decarboxylase, partial [Actinobacteria bacterium]|nr:orotidine-5'-phosphate decarboxylase [Actinomycetota bacterium]
MLSESARDSIIVALDCDVDEARHLAAELSGHARWLKVGMTLYYAAGPAIVKELTDLGFKVFVDLKLHDIPHQVHGAAKSLAKIGASMITIHASGGSDMMCAACDAIAEEFPQGEGKPIVLAITVLTSTDEAMLKNIGVAKPLPEQVEALARMADDSG